MSFHISAKPGEIAPSILLPGDPLRAKFIAETLLENPVCFNQVRNMFGYTGTYKGKPVSVMGTGMGIPSISIYVSELIMQYGVKTLIRVGTSGSFQKHVRVGDIIIAMSACTDSNINNVRFPNISFAPTADFGLLLKAYNKAQELKAKVTVGSVFSSDTFYGDDPDWWKKLADFGVLAAEMEAAALYTLAAKHHVAALALVTVSDSLVEEQMLSAEEREKGLALMATIALETAL